MNWKRYMNHPTLRDEAGEGDSGGSSMNDSMAIFGTGSGAGTASNSGDQGQEGQEGQQGGQGQDGGQPPAPAPAAAPAFTPEMLSQIIRDSVSLAQQAKQPPAKVTDEE